MALKAAFLSLGWQYVAQEQPKLFLWVSLLGRHAASSLDIENEIS